MQPVPLLDQQLSRVLGARTGKPLGSALDLHTVGQLLQHYPRRYATRGELTVLSELVIGEHATVVAEVVSISTRQMKQRDGHMAEVVVTDGATTLELVFFARRANLVGYWQRSLAVGRRALFAGKVATYRGRLQLVNPEFDPLTADAGDDLARAMADELIPIYPATKRVQSWVVRTAVRTVLTVLTADDVPDPVPPRLLAARRMPSAADALLLVHQPTDPEQYRRGRRRLRFEEAFVLQVALARRRAQAAALPATPRPRFDAGLVSGFDARLPFALTPGQVEVGETLSQELAREHPMHRLLHGEVGSGKTVVALRAMLTVVDAGGQAALLAPTEVLATQHDRSIRTMLGDLAEGGMLGGAPGATRVVLLTGSQPAGVRKAVLSEIASGEAGIVVGTHALIQEAVQFADLGLVVVDEQHKFGVEQRDALRAKAVRTPHLLVMTATPIPRTVAMTVFGDLATSTLTELPAGRRPITTHIVPMGNDRWMARTWGRVREEVDAGRQVFVVCPRIGDPDTGAGSGSGSARAGTGAGAGDEDGGDGGGGDGGGMPAPDEPRPALSVLEVLELLHEQPVLHGVRFGLLHGRLPTEERDAVMQAFARGDVDVLVATTVVEVGVDVPGATLMVVMDATRFGVSQLHQLRGRVGRGEHPSVCLLVTDAEPGSPGGERLAAVAATQDGFTLAQVDLEARREGDVLGAAQSGMRSSLKLLRVVRDVEVIADARAEATAIVDVDPELVGYPALRERIARLEPDKEVFLDRG